ncbi:uncharacterized protein [Euphorbia lathyris]|uniref:uncharacterized protein n=1 Tax=Euphorbia lathyris TaxID=212925 RepID=UPI0033131FC2
MAALQLSQKLSRSLLSSSSSPSSSLHRTLTTLAASYRSLSNLLSPDCLISYTATGNLNQSPWSAIQNRGAKVTAIDLRPGNVIETKGKIFQVVDVEHKQRGRGGASMQIELRNVDNGNKQSLRFGTEEAVERVYVEERSFTLLYAESGRAYLMDLQKCEQLEVPTELFGESAQYLKEDIKVKLQLYDETPLSGTIPKQVKYTIKDMKGLAATPRYKKAILDNDLIIQVPSYLDAGEEIIVDTTEHSFISRAK